MHVPLRVLGNDCLSLIVALLERELSLWNPAAQSHCLLLNEKIRSSVSLQRTSPFFNSEVSLPNNL